ncbi:hypothetical protein [Microbacterium sp. Se63.02b]|uniref:hypothetical protein n=1 Tax=Microbacterium sp. Se63.02b TaxID=2709304 RepID=UPI0016054D67|nr:hypothetical protein [Microbacterium sp. Se63.02b]QNA93199.1 hypothetical protein G4G29_14415 [Microbacterium sp. Se63.02b]
MVNARSAAWAAAVSEERDTVDEVVVRASAERPATAVTTGGYGVPSGRSRASAVSRSR